ncbi:flagellar biosynthetic protein FliR [Swingsia samuiensis]|uniref:Type III secretion protein n=1 Tax=Swingsia samuiensis TaxID=1293412 RepID=A0A4Y6UHR2_9PROT|nr:flagellar biosynthetic protein FliR [Swingsia samuiensis]QDH16574.1 type III secretion protein [Swingsia samuiensis]
MSSSVINLSLPEGITQTAFLFMLVLSRISAAIMVMPGFSYSEIPSMIKAGLALTLTFLIYPLIHIPPISHNISPWEIGGMVALELFIGFFIGWITQLTAFILPIAGQFISVFIGLSSVLQPDQSLGADTSALARFMNLLAPVMLMVSGAYIFPIYGLINSYSLISPNIFFHNNISIMVANDITKSVIQKTEDIFKISLELSSPFLILSLIWQMIIGVLTRLSPNLQIQNNVSSLQMLGGIALVGISLVAMITVWQQHTFTILQNLSGF